MSDDSSYVEINNLNDVDIRFLPAIYLTDNEKEVLYYIIAGKVLQKVLKIVCQKCIKLAKVENCNPSHSFTSIRSKHINGLVFVSENIYNFMIHIWKNIFECYVALHEKKKFQTCHMKYKKN